MSILDDLEKKVDSINSSIMNEDVGKDDDSKSKIGRKAFLTDPFLEISSSQGSYRQKFTRLSNRMLRESSIRDTVIQSIIRHRRTQVEAFCNIPNTRFDTGFTFVRRDGAQLTSDDYEDVSKWSNWMYFCGDVHSTPTDDRTTLATQFGMLTQDMLTFGHISLEKVRDAINGLQRIRHVAAESVFHATKGNHKAQVERAVIDNTNAIPDSYQNEGKVFSEDPNKPVRWVQHINGREVASFTEDTMVFKLFQPPSFVDNNGYSTSLVEACILAITRHLQAENYNSLFFTHGFAARGLLHLKGNVSQANLQMFRNQFNSVINGNNNSWRTPIIAGLDEVQWVPLAGTSRDMEYIQYTDHLIRTICAIAQIDPTEIGFEYLSRGTQQSTLNSPNNEWKLTASQERGLVPILRFLEDIVNHDILTEMNTEFAKKYMFKFVGLQSETKQQEIARLQQEMSVHASLNDLLVQVKKDPMDKELAADIPLNSLWWGMIKEVLTVGEIREKMLGDKGASERDELKYIPSASFLQWQQFLSQQSQQQMQQKQMQQEQEIQEKQNNMSGANMDVPKTPMK